MSVVKTAGSVRVGAMGLFSKKSNGKAEAAKPVSLSDAIPSLAPTRALAAAPAVSAPPPPSAAPAAFTAAAVATPTATTQATTAMPASRLGSAPASLPPEELAKHKAHAKQVSAAFGEIVTLLMRDPASKHRSLTDLEWLVVPPLLAGQFSLAEAQSKSKGVSAPVAVVLWARVSAEVDKRLSAASDGPIRLAPGEWASGETIWVVEAIGDRRVIEAVLQKLRDGDWAGKTTKLRNKGSDD
jgi:hemolysin-activating ACP:hemolysin acyltransferase